jgi:hypothetical protein
MASTAAGKRLPVQATAGPFFRGPVAAFKGRRPGWDGQRFYGHDRLWRRLAGDGGRLR